MTNGIFIFIFFNAERAGKKREASAAFNSLIWMIYAKYWRLLSITTADTVKTKAKPISRSSAHQCLHCFFFPSLELGSATTTTRIFDIYFSVLNKYILVKKVEEMKLATNARMRNFLCQWLGRKMTDRFYYPFESSSVRLNVLNLERMFQTWDGID